MAKKKGLWGVVDWMEKVDARIDPVGHKEFLKARRRLKKDKSFSLT